jgi:hypothetical protein
MAKKKAGAKKSGGAKTVKLKWIGLAPGQSAKATRAFNKLKKEGKSAAYARRVARAEAVGKTRQEARGHHAGEHIERRQHGGLTKSQRERVTAFYQDQYNPTNRLRDRASLESVLDHVTEKGMKFFNQWKSAWQGLRGDWTSKGEPQSPGLYSTDEIEDFADEFEVPDISWLYYH